MSDTYNVYCDETCHLENDQKPVMVLGAVWCSVAKRKGISTRLREIKERHGLPRDFEVKSTKVSPAKLPFYRDLLDYFFDDDDLHFRALVVPDKTRLDHRRFEQDHDTWYYKMYFDMLKVIFAPDSRYRVYLDIKDTTGSSKVRKLHDVLCNNLYDFSRQIITRVQLVHSSEVDILQLTDLLVGIVRYANESIQHSEAKQRLVQRTKQRSGYSLIRSTLLRESKFNVFVWRPQTDSQ